MFQVLIELCPASSHMFPIHSFARYFLYYFFLNMIFMFASFDKKKSNKFVMLCYIAIGNCSVVMIISGLEKKLLFRWSSFFCCVNVNVWFSYFFGIKLKGKKKNRKETSMYIFCPHVYSLCWIELKLRTLRLSEIDIIHDRKFF